MNLRLLPGWRVGGALLAALGAIGAGRAADAPERDAEMIPLEPLIVVERRLTPALHEARWLHGRSGEFEVLSNAGGRETREAVQEFHRLHLLFTRLFPQVQVPKRRPLTLLLCEDAATFASLQPAAATGAAPGSAAFLLGDENAAVLVLALRPSRGESALREPRDRLLPWKREYVRHVLSQREARAPAWLEEGLGQLFALAEVDEGKLRFGALARELVAEAEAAPVAGEPLKLPRRESLETLAVFFQRRGFLPLEEFFARSWYSDVGSGPARAAFALQSLAFVHYCLYAQDGAHQMAFMNLITRLEREPAGEAVFSACFGQGYREFVPELRAYLQRERYLAAAAKDFPLPEAPEPELRAAKPAEWLRVQGDVHRLAGRSDAAAATLQRALDGNHTDARLFAAVGFLQQQRNRPDEALLAFRNAATAQVALPGPYLALARYRLRASSPDDGDTTLNRREFVSAMRFVMAARQHMHTPRRDLYQIAAEAWIRAPVSPLNQNLELLEEGVMAFPNDTWLVADTAELKRRIGRLEDAHHLAQRGLRIAKDEAVRSRFVELANETKPAGHLAGR